MQLQVVIVVVAVAAAADVAVVVASCRRSLRQFVADAAADGSKERERGAWPGSDPVPMQQQLAMEAHKN